MPAFAAARIALTCPRVNETGATSTRCLWLAIFDNCCPSARLGVFGSNLPRRFASSRDTVMSWSSSRSSSCLRALGRSLGKTCRHSCVGETFFVHGDGAREGPAVEKRSRVGCLVRSRPMPGIMPRPASAGNVGQQSLPRERASLTWQRLYVFRTQYRVAAESGVEYGFLDRVEAGHELRISLSARLFDVPRTRSGGCAWETAPCLRRLGPFRGLISPFRASPRCYCIDATMHSC
jgi:hypothetical protein